MTFTDVINGIDEYLWYVAIVLIVCMGIYCTVRFGGLQFRSLREMCRVTFGNRKNGDGDKLSSFQVFCMSMGSRIGVGNISGPILAILVGGPGAIFWMWVFAVIGSATSFVETTIGQLYKERMSDGSYRGGPAYYVTKALGMRRLGIVVAFIVILMYIVGFVSMEVSSMSSAICGAIQFEGNNWVFAIVITLVSAAVLAGGARRVADLSVKIVPAMALIWFVAGIAVIALSDGGVIQAFSLIFESAFNVPAAVGGGIGAMLLAGMQRGVLSNEAGVGTIPNISSMADVKHPAAQGMTQALGVLIDTCVCTITALIVLSFGGIMDSVGTDVESMHLLEGVFTASIGSVGPYLVAAFLFFFAFTSMISDFIIGENNLLRVRDTRMAQMWMRVVLLVVIFISSLIASDDLYTVVDILLAVCAFVNTYVIIRLGGRALEAYRDYRRQKDEGVVNPEFHKSVMSDTTGMTEWPE